MKKNIFVLLIILSCFSYKNNVNAENIIEKQQTKFVDTVFAFVNESKKVVKSVVEETIKWYDENKEEINQKINDVIEDPTTSVKEGIKNANEWYDENKDGLKETSKEVMEETKQAIKENFENANEWYDENKDELKEASKEVMEETKNQVKNIIDKGKNWYDEYLKDTVTEIYNNDKDALSDLYDKLKKSE